ncbi:MAG: stage V sporulation protein AD [Clostridia bacterium]|nr:stage V sporulation protein AD [Clostridia bacterium]
MRKQTLRPDNVYLKSTFSSVGKKESEGPLNQYFDAKYKDDLLGQECWEKAESTLLKTTVSGALTSAKLTCDELDMLFAGDLLNQCTASSFALKAFDIPFLGLYGACSTFAEGLCLASMTISGGFAKNCGVVTSSHFCSSQKQYRFPLEYGEVRTPTSQWTVTGSGCAILSCDKSEIKITAVTPGRIVDLGVSDANNMGAAMAPAAADTIYSHLCETNKSPDDYDHIITGDLALVGSDLLCELLRQKGIDISKKHLDCGSLIFDAENQKVNAGGSGCGCVASVFSGYISQKLKSGEMKNILLVATGALMSPSSVLLGESISGVAHAVEFERTGD